MGQTLFRISILGPPCAAGPFETSNRANPLWENDLLDQGCCRPEPLSRRDALARERVAIRRFCDESSRAVTPNLQPACYQPGYAWLLRPIVSVRIRCDYLQSEMGATPNPNEWLTGQADAFEVIVGEHYEPLYRFALNLTHAEADARDLTQQAFFVWATKGHQLRDRSKVKTWLFTTLYRAFLATKRQQGSFPHCGLEETSLPSIPWDSRNLDSSEVLSALARVDQVFQPAVSLFYLEDYSYKSIAEILGVPVGTVKSRIARGLIQLREFLHVDPEYSEGQPGAGLSCYSH